MEKLIQVQIKNGQERKFRQGQSWIFSQDVAEIPRELKDGSLIEVRSAKGEFIGRGYWNSESKILGRIVTFDSRENDLLELSFFVRRLKNCFISRRKDNFRGSFRLCFGEGDYFPGVVIDYYRIRNSDQNIYQSFVIQTSTLGIERAFQRKGFGWENVMRTFLKEMSDSGLANDLDLLSEEKTAVVLRNDMGARKHEGLEIEPTRLVWAPRELDLTKVQIAVNDLSDERGLVWMNADLIHGQKTGFFLDQTRNIQRLLQMLKARNFIAGDTVRIVDLCCYLGHWSTQMANYFSKKGIKAEFHLVDISEKALELASENVKQFSDNVTVYKKDVLKDLSDLTSQKFDIVVCDPPAFIKSKKDLPTGQHAYTKLNRSAVEMTKPGGWMVTCSCSGLLTPDLFKQVIMKAQESYRPEWRLLEEGGLPTDHPRHLGFSEGAYLKMYLFEKSPV